MQVFFSYIVCPECRARNTPWRSFCKTCRGPLAAARAPARAHDDVTITVYRAPDPDTLLLVSPQYLAYKTRGLSIQSAWENIGGLRADASGPFLSLKKPAALAVERALIADPAYFSRRIPLRPFGFPESGALRADLARYLPGEVARRTTL